MNPLISPARLVELARERATVIFDATLAPPGLTNSVDVRARYLERHLPGALFFDIEKLSDDSTSLPHMLPQPEEFGRQMSRLGVADDMTIVVYEQGDVFSAPRALWMLRTMGAKQVYLLDGGLQAWIDEGLPAESGLISRRPAMFRARLDLEAIAGFAGIQQVIAAKGTILDARSPGRFQGTTPEPRPGIRSGHMPGAMNVPYTELIERNRMKPEERLRAFFAARGIALEEPIVTSCGSGVTAAVISLALEMCGASKTKLYDGSWAEYAQKPESVIQRMSETHALE